MLGGSRVKLSLRAWIADNGVAAMRVTKLRTVAMTWIEICILKQVDEFGLDVCCRRRPLIYERMESKFYTSEGSDRSV